MTNTMEIVPIYFPEDREEVLNWLHLFTTEAKLQTIPMYPSENMFKYAIRVLDYLNKFYMGKGITAFWDTIEEQKKGPEAALMLMVELQDENLTLAYSTKEEKFLFVNQKNPFQDWKTLFSK